MISMCEADSLIRIVSELKVLSKGEVTWVLGASEDRVETLVVVSVV